MTEQEKTKKSFRDEINVRELLLRYLSYWKWFAASVLISMSVAYVILRYTQQSYESRAKVLINFEKTGAYSELYAFQDLGLFEGTGNYNNLHNEREILRSRSVIEGVVRQLDLHIQYNLIGSKTGIERRELYKNSPVEFVLLKGDSADIKAPVRYDIELLSNSRFQFLDNERFGTKIYRCMDTLEAPSIGKFYLKTTRFYKMSAASTNLSILVRPIESTVSTYQALLTVEPISDQVDILQLSIRGPNIQKNNDFLDSLIAQHTRQTIEDQLQIYRHTTNFINDRIATISEELSDVEKEGESYKSQYDFSDILMSEKSLYDRTLFNERSLIEAEVQLELIQYLYDYLNRITDNENLLPANLGLDDYGINHAVENYNRVALERLKVLEHSSAKNPSVIKLDAEMASIRSSLKASLSNSKTSLQMEVNRLRAKESSINAEISELPKHKRVLRSIDRQQQVKEQLYLYLLQKREENEIASAVSEGNSTVIEAAYSNGAIVSPNRKVYYAAALFIGLFIPFSMVYLLSLLDNKVRKPEDLEENGLTHLASIPWLGRNKAIFTAESATPEAEAFRILRTNTSFLLGRQTEGGQVILTSSMIAQEGKSFVAINLGASFSLTGKKTLVIGMDLRSPKILEYAGLPRNKGITDLLIDPKLKWQNLVQKDPVNHNLFYLSSGTIPPNPAEILMQPELKDLLDEIRKAYDVILIDSAPVALVTDTLLISHLADICVFVVRANFLEKQRLATAAKLAAEGKLPRMGVVLNAIEKNQSGNYGYGYGEEPRKARSILHRLMKR